MQTFLEIGAIASSVLLLGWIAHYFWRLKVGKVRHNVLTTVWLLVMLNFQGFWWLDVVLGGDALNGKVVGDQHFLGAHGYFTPVSYGLWLYSLLHTSITIATFVVGGLWLLFGVLTGKLELPATDDELHPRGRGTV